MIYQPPTYDEWVMVEPLFGSQTLGLGRPRVASLRAEAIVHVLTTKCRLVHLPHNLGFPSHITARHSSKRWQQKDTMDVVLAAPGPLGRVLRPSHTQKAVGVDVARGGNEDLSHGAVRKPLRRTAGRFSGGSRWCN
ncbi:hypothetical protein BC1002_7084 (plasmid) [Paraburkholderia atlantica]|uniref:Insertion element IS402-like domain-containing protein n=2 Tax=Paraburkholderia atlantica TaxID=2654982 RepID=D5WNF8_PARAM|nr:hypothetical protein BC1002_7084 [Paraburkholderia atlantica]